MSHDLPSPLRDLSVRTYVCIIWQRLIDEFHPFTSSSHDDAPVRDIYRNLQISRNLMGCDDDAHFKKKIVQRFAEWLDGIKSAALIEKHLQPLVVNKIKATGSIDLENIKSDFLQQAVEAAMKDQAANLESLPSLSTHNIRGNPRDVIRLWINTARAILLWDQNSTLIRRQIAAIECNRDVRELAESVQQLGHEKIVSVYTIAEDCFKGSPIDTKTSERRKNLLKELHSIKLDIGKLTGLAIKLEDEFHKGSQLELKKAHQDRLLGFAEQADSLLKNESECWPPNVLLSLWKKRRISLNELAASIGPDTDPFRPALTSAADGDVQLHSLCQLTELMARSMAETGALKETAYQKEFEQAVNCMFRPFAGELQILWDCPEEIEQFSDIVEVSRVEPFESASCEQVAILFTNKNKQVHIVQKGKYSKPELMPPIGTKLNDLADQLEQCKGHDPKAVRQIREFIDELKGFDELREWWKNKHSDRNDELLWSVMTSLTGLILIGPPARDTDHVQSKAGEVYDAFVNEEFYWERLDAEAVEDNRQPENPEWAIVSLPLEGEIGAKTAQVATHQPCGLRVPEGEFLLPPNKWLVVAPSLLNGCKLLSCLYRCTPQRDRLIKLSPDWEGLKLWDEAVVSHHHGEPDKHDRDRMAFELFEAAYRRKGDEKHGQIFKKIACQLYQCLGELKVDHWPRLDGKSLDFKKASPVDIEKYAADIEWVQDNRPHGSIVQVDRFAFAGEQSKVQLSLGTGFSDRAKAWMDLFARIAVEDAAGPLDGLDSIRKKVKALPASKSVDAQVDKIDKIEKELKEWLKSKEGEQALNAAMTQICSDPSVLISRLWIDLLKLLEQTEDFEIFPAFALQEDRCEVSWPAGVPESALIDWNFDATIPVGQLIDQRVTFSLDVARAAGTFSLGPESPASPISVAHGLMQLGETLSNVELKAAAEQLRKASIESSSTEHMPAEAAVQELLQMLTADALWKDVGLDLRDGLLAGIRSWCGFFKYQIDPKEFTYAEGTLPPGESEQLEAVFNAHSAVGQALVAKYGLLDPSGKALVSGACKVSAGPAPAGYEELLEKLRTIDELKHLMPLAGRWPAQRLKSERALANAIKGDFFEELFKSLEALGGDERAVKLQKTFAEILKSELSAFLFSPTRIGDVDEGWLKPVNRSETMSGKIKKVIKPGLRDNKGMLIAPAVVELD